jgi:hypothetical protein
LGFCGERGLTFAEKTGALDSLSRRMSPGIESKLNVGVTGGALLGLEDGRVLVAGNPDVFSVEEVADVAAKWGAEAARKRERLANGIQEVSGLSPERSDEIAKLGIVFGGVGFGGFIGQAVRQPLIGALAGGVATWWKYGRG